LSLDFGFGLGIFYHQDSNFFKRKIVKMKVNIF